jgi:hypothetical protein
MAKYKAFVIEAKLPGIFAIRKTYFYSSRRNSKLLIKSNFSVFTLWKHRIIVNVFFFVTYHKHTKMHYIKCDPTLDVSRQSTLYTKTGLRVRCLTLWRRIFFFNLSTPCM